MYLKVRANAILNCDDSKADNQFSAWNLRVFKLVCSTLKVFAQ